MLATLGGFLALLVGLLLLLLPLLASELSRARDSVWGAVVLLLGLVLVTSAERLTGAPMLAVLCGGLLIGRLGVEVGQARWRQLSDEERQRLWSWERWRTSLNQLGAALARLLQLAAGLVTGLGAWLAERRAARAPPPPNAGSVPKPKDPPPRLPPNRPSRSTQPTGEPEPRPRRRRQTRRPGGDEPQAESATRGDDALLETGAAGTRGRDWPRGPGDRGSALKSRRSMP